MERYEEIEQTITKRYRKEIWKKFIKEEFLKSKLECDEKNEELYVLCDKLETLKFTAQEREAEYQMRQKQVTTYLQCRKSFFGRIRYFFKGKKKVKEEKEEIILNKRVKHENNKQEFIYDNKE